MKSDVEMNMKIQKIISELIERNVIAAEPSEYKKLKGGTVSELYLLNIEGTKYVLKLNDPEVTGPEALFLDTYKEGELLPKLLFVDQSGNYIVYSFIDGSTVYEGGNKKEILKALVEELINKYKTASPESGWGWADSPVTSWQNFLRNEINNAHKVIGSQMDETDHQLVIKIVEKIGIDTEAFLLHGDCGFHNFIFTDQELVGVIDPAPVIGDPIYDLVYAFCSSADDLTKETFDYATSYMKVGKEKEQSVLYENLLIGLYLRIALCSKHHPDDLPYYLEAWSEWLEITGDSQRNKEERR